MSDNESVTVRGTISNVSGGQVAIGQHVTQTSTSITTERPSDAEIAGTINDLAFDAVIIQNTFQHACIFFQSLVRKVMTLDDGRGRQKAQWWVLVVGVFLFELQLWLGLRFCLL